MKTNIQKTEINKTKKIPWSLGRNWFMQQHFLLQITQIHSSYLTVHVVNNPNQTGVYIFKKNDLIYTSSFSFFFYSRAWRNTLSIGFLWRVFWFDFDFFFFQSITFPISFVGFFAPLPHPSCDGIRNLSFIVTRKEIVTPETAVTGLLTVRVQFLKYLSTSKKTDEIASRNLSEYFTWTIKMQQQQRRNVPIEDSCRTRNN